MHVVGAVLAGGKSRRMGGNKALLPWAGAPLFAQVAHRLAAQTEAVVISSSANPALFAPWQVLADRFAAHGPLAGIHSGLLWAKAQGASHLLTAPCDMPFVPTDLLARLALHDCAYAIDGQSLHPCPTLALWPIHALESVETLLDARALRLTDLCRTLNAAPVAFDSAALVNLNTPEDLAQCLSS